MTLLETLMWLKPKPKTVFNILSVYIVQVFLACKQVYIREEYTLSKELRKRFSGIDIVSTDFILCNIG